MVKLFQHNKSDMNAEFKKRLLLVLTKSDLWFHDTGRADKAWDHLQDWRRNFYGCEPMLMGSTFDREADTSDPKCRNDEYKKANGREERIIKEFRETTIGMALEQEQKHYWERLVGFVKVQATVQKLSLQMDMKKIPSIKQTILHQMRTVQSEMKRTADNISCANPQQIARNCGKLVSAILSDTTKLLQRIPGAGLDIHLSSKDLKARGQSGKLLILWKY